MRNHRLSTRVRRAAVALAAALLALPLVAARADAYIYWSENPGAGQGMVGRANDDGSGKNLTFLRGLFGAQAVAVDSTYLYWANGPSQIGRARLDGTEVNPSFVTGAVKPSALAVDPVNGYLFWVNQQDSAIGRADLATGANIHNQLVDTLLPTTGVAVDGATRTIYWTTYAGAGNGAIGRAGVDGSGVDRGWLGRLFGAQGLTLDGTYLYWADGPDEIGRVGLDGTGADPTFNAGARIGTKGGSPDTTSVPMAVGGGYLYWGNLFDGYIGRVSSVDGKSGLNNYFISILGSATGLAYDGLASPGPLPPVTRPEVAQLKTDVERLDLPLGIERSLLGRLDLVGRALDSGDTGRACTLLDSYARRVETLSGRVVPASPAAGLLADAQVTAQALGCSEG